jgi:hypothetical protein
MWQILRMLHTLDRQGLWSNWEDLGENVHASLCSTKTEFRAMQNINSPYHMHVSRSVRQSVFQVSSH